MLFRFAAIAAALFLSFPAFAGEVIDRPIPTFAPFRNITAKENTDKVIDLAQYATAKKTVVLIFVANRCGVTWLYADKIAALVRDFGTRPDIAILLIHSNFEESDQEIVTTLKQRKLSLPLLDDKPKQVLATYFDAHVTPVFVVIDPKGVLRYRGAFDQMGGSVPAAKRPQYLRPALAAVLAGKPVAIKATRALGCDIARRSQHPAPLR